MLAAVSMEMEFPFVCRAATMALASYVLELTLRVPKIQRRTVGESANASSQSGTSNQSTRFTLRQARQTAWLNPGRVSWKQGTRVVKRPVR